MSDTIDHSRDQKVTQIQFRNLRDEIARLESQLYDERERADRAVATMNLILGELRGSIRGADKHIANFKKKHPAGVI